MRTNIDIDDKLMRQAMKATGAITKKAAVEAALQLAVRLRRQSQALDELWGIGWGGNLDQMRADEHPSSDSDVQTANRVKRKSAA
ncbi:type II toxin-antitoxin system VapB family antitoxin [Terracidiphilus gabretensis]|jgi:Arc/MetJ family transcription regulator|uniref:type II toxin-antitoxin system VapB family antitoxin n=1 Tax=Terracidiphilus gabretensis TaxID=1577687 RepID=UPI00071BB4A1|nr:type II toxin-antitoxin system VapB family antitoxin [Terracidiphilus gabretensis]